MQTVELKKKNTLLIPKVRVARSFGNRLIGLLGKKEIAADEALLFPKCNSIHTFFMQMPIDVVFIAKDGIVVAVANSLRPWRMLSPKRKVAHTLEMRAERSRELGIAVGDQLQCDGVF